MKLYLFTTERNQVLQQKSKILFQPFKCGTAMK